MTTNIEESLVRAVPEDLKKMLLSNFELLEKWNKLTPLMRNEWTCRRRIAKQEATRKEYIERLPSDIFKDKKCADSFNHF